MVRSMWDQLQKEQQQNSDKGDPSGQDGGQDKPSGNDNPAPPNPGSGEDDLPKPGNGGDDPPQPGGDNNQGPSNSQDKPGGENDDPPDSSQQPGILQDIFGESVESVEAAKERLNQLSSQAETYKGQAEQFKQFLNKKLDPFANSEMRQFNTAASKYGIDDMNVFRTINGVTEDMVKQRPIDVLVAKKLVDYPRLSGQESNVHKIILEENGMNVDEEIDWDNIPPYKRAQLEASAHKAYSELKKIQDDVSSDSDSGEGEKSPIEKLIEQENQQQEGLKNQWTPIVEKMAPDFKQLVIPEGDSKYTFSLSDEQLQDIKSKTIDYLVKNGKPFTEEAVKEARNYAMSVAAQSNFSDLLKGYGDFRAAQALEQSDNKNNPRQGQHRNEGDPPDPGKGGETQLSPAEQAERFRTENQRRRF